MKLSCVLLVAARCIYATDVEPLAIFIGLCSLWFYGIKIELPIFNSSLGR